MPTELDDFFRDTQSVRKVNLPPTRDDIVRATTAFETRGPNRVHSQAPVKPKGESMTVTSLSGITESMWNKKDTLPLFPNAEKLGKEAEQVVYALLLGTFLTQKNLRVLDTPQSHFREQAFALFGNTHRKKAFAVADFLYRHRVLFSDPIAPKAASLFHAVHNPGDFQLGLPVFTTVNFHPDETAKNIIHWEPVITDTARDALTLQFEVTVAAFCGNRIIRHPFDVVAEDLTGTLHVIEISNRRNASYTDNPARMVEDALLERAADLMQIGSWDQHINLFSQPRRVGAGEVWTLKDKPGERNSATRIHLSDEEMSQALEILTYGNIT